MKTNGVNQDSLSDRILARVCMRAIAFYLACVNHVFFVEGVGERWMRRLPPHIEVRCGV
ncbi:hypothetical protein [Chlorogloeopsis sp. ULAP02]|uniref:hypothetical protein n=1 Tax=Chlorogloeopsis sp. ULAP02 TaxID=3107926 RepID=UPI003136F739